MDKKNQTGTKPETRRRGAQLEEAILRATKEELAEVGYSRLTIEGVANRAGTSKAVIYRRYPNRGELVLNAIRQRIPLPYEEIPNTGNLREDLIQVLRLMNRILTEIGAETVHGIMVELGEVPLSTLLFPNGRTGRATTTVLKQAEERGELQFDKITPRMRTLPVDLIRHELLLSYEPVSEQTIAEIVDDIYLPLILK
ncbi:TetR/AcrR family transcriptional regulator [Gorillibacterium timonense]|uniref:TetR/AcrR family transcriptional regulator n=1 Tax=Gorillibacterium timonense TaxID=1689269 RepID=UPI00071D2448|nr:TetR/AcrR family transcriptional regulator [Gorillibacterium timonense]